MAGLIINRTELRNKIYGCWLGKNIGGTLGGPYEGTKEVLDVQGYSTPAGEPLPNDDLDLQLVWLKAVQDNGPLGINSRVLGEYWLNCIPPDWNEYGICKSNMRAGLLPPLSGMYNNPWKHSNGAWIRSEIWACLAPGCPDIAIRFAYEDASVDHGAGEGTYAAIFTTAIESAAFVVADRDELIKIGLSKIPADCRVTRSINITLDAHSNGLTWREARDLVVEDSADLGWFQAPANVAFVVIGWIYGDGDFGKSIKIAVNCGDDTDCTAATLGATMGIILGKDCLPKEWVEPIGDRIITVAIDRTSLPLLETLEELTNQVMAQVPVALTQLNANVEISEAPSDISAAANIDFKDDKAARALWGKSPYSVTYNFVHTTVTLDYGADPEVTAGVAFPIQLTFKNTFPDSRHLDVIWHLPEGWAVSQGANHVALHHWPNEVVASVEIVANELHGSTHRGAIEINTPGRPTVGFIPLIFFSAK